MNVREVRRLVALAIASIGMSAAPLVGLAQTPPAATPSADARALPCPSILELQSPDGVHYVAVFSASGETVAAIDLRLFTGSSDATASLASLNISTPIAGRDRGQRFRSKALVFRNSTGRPFIAAMVRASIAGSKDACPARYRGIRSPADVAAGHAPTGSAAVLAAAIASETATGAPIPLATAPATPFACATPFADAKVVDIAQPVYPATHGSGETLVKVDLDATGVVASASVFKSSGDELLDGAAVAAARESTYTPAIVRCVAMPGSYIFRTDFRYGRR